MLRIEIENRSEWPDYFVGPVVRWIVRRVGVGKVPVKSFDRGVRVVLNPVRRYRVRLGSPRGRVLWRGWGMRSGQRSGIRRRPPVKFPYDCKDRRVAYAFSFVLRSPVEAFVFLVAHEACHAAEGARLNWESASGRCDAQGMEQTCNRVAAETVRAFRMAWPGHLAARVSAGARRARLKRRPLRRAASVAAVAEARAARDRVALAKAEGYLAVWLRKQRLASTKVKKYQRAVARLRKRMEVSDG